MRTPLVGRERDVALARELLLRRDVPLLALSGPAGIGKTRLALQVVADLRGAFLDGVCFVSLASISDPGNMAATIAEALGIPDRSGRDVIDRLCAYLRHKEMLLFLDNFEHIMAAAPLVTHLLTSCPSLRVLVTSRERCRLSDEHDFPVPALALPDLDALPPAADLAQIDAVTLFVQRASAIDPTFALTAANASEVAEICVRLDGLPLAIELAAARIRYLTPAALRSRLTHRLLLLTGGPHDQPPRLRSMRDAIAWSFDLLSPEEQALFRRVAVFTGGFTLDAAEAVSRAVEESRSRDDESEVGGRRSDESTAVTTPQHPIAPSPYHPSSPSPPSVLDLVASLVDKSLVEPTGQAGDEARFRLLDTIHEFASERLATAGEAAAARAAHAQIFLELAETAESHLRGPRQATWFHDLEREHPNPRAALSWFHARHELVPALRLAGALGRFWEVRGRLTEGRGWLVVLLAGVDRESPASVPSLVRAKAESWAGTLSYWQGDYLEADALHERAWHRYEEAGDDRGAALSLLNLGQSATCRGELERGRQLVTASLDRFRAIGDPWGIAAAQTGLVQPLFASGDLARVERLLADGLPRVRAAGDPDLLAMTLFNVGWLASSRGDDAEAEHALAESLALFRQIGERRAMPYTLNLLGLLAWRRGDVANASSLLAEGLTLSHGLGVRLATVNGLTTLATVASTATHGAAVARLLGAAEAIREAIGSPPPPVERPVLAATAASARASLGEPAFAAAWAAGRALSREAAIAEGLALAASLSQLDPIDEEPARGNTSDLSPRERDVLRLLVEGHSNPEIAAALFVSPKTVRNHVTSILAKLGVKSRTAAVTFALRHKLI